MFRFKKRTYQWFGTLGDRERIENASSGGMTFEIRGQETLTQKQKAEALLEKLKNKIKK